MRSAAHAMRIPGTHALLERFETADGTGVLAAAGRVYLARRGPVTEVDNGFVRTFEVATDRALVRHAVGGDASWTEEYRADVDGRPAVVDGVRIERDAAGRVRACTGPEGAWQYGYSGERLVRIVTPRAIRRIVWHGDRPVACVQNGVRLPIEPVDRENGDVVDGGRVHRDALGRIWTETGADGRVIRTWLWDGFFCFARIDGPPGEDVAAAFSLDPSGTPVRIITRHGVVRVPRDAFGEALLAHPYVPGLFGGLVRNGRVHYAGRTMDPLAGAFTTPDPCDGGMADPRRGAWTGGLPTELEHGRYAVCRNDPVGRADPTGLVSWGVILSDLTWSLQNNTLAIFGLDLSVNFWTSFFTLCVPRSRGYFTTFQFETGSRQATWALLRQGLISRQGRAWTFQHLLHDAPADLDALEVCRVLVPAGRFEPLHYGTVLRFSPADGTAAILSGDQNVDGGADWSRHGGAAEPVFPGSAIPWFPSGGLHLDNPLPGPVPGDTGTLTELEPTGPVAAGTGQGLPSVVVPGTGYGLVQGDLLLLTDAALQAEIIAVQAADESGGSTTVILAANPAIIGNTGVRVRRLENAPVTSEPITQGPDAATLDFAATAPPTPPPDYEVGDPLRFSQGATALGAGLIQRFETRLRVDSALPPLGTDAQVFTTSPGNTGQGTLTANAGELQVTTGSPVPGANEAVLVTNGTTTIACIVLSASADDPPLLTLDRSIGALGNSGDTVDWTRLVTTPVPISASGSTASAAGDVLTYSPALERTAPAAGRTLVIVSSTVRAARTVTAIVADLIVCEQPIGATGAITVERMRFAAGSAAIDSDDLTLTQQLTLTLANPTAFTADALRLIDTGVTAITVTPSGSYMAITDATATVTNPLAPDISAAGVVWLGPAATGEFALIRRIIARATLDRRIEALEGAPFLSVVRVQAAGPRYDANRLSERIVAVRPTIAGNPWQFPRFAAGQLVRLTWTGGSDVYRIDTVEPFGSTITLTDGPDLPAATPDLVVERLDLGFQLTGGQINTATLTVADPGTGGIRHGIRGTARTIAPAGTDVTELTVDVWRTRTLANGDILAIVAGAVAHPAIIMAIEWDVEFSEAPSIAPSAAAPVSITSVNNTPQPAAVPGVLVPQNGFAQRFRLEAGNTAVTIFDAPFTPPAANLVLAVPYRATATSIDVTVGSGTTLVPDEPEFGELDRRQSLVDHELMHTVQSATWGPLLFCWFPLLAFQIPVELATDIELPKFSATAKAKVSEDSRGRFLEIEENPASVPFAAGDVVQVTRELQKQHTLFLETKISETRFKVRSISPAAQLEAGPVLASPGDQEALGGVGAVVRFESNAIFLDIPDAGGLTFQEGGQAKVYFGDPLGVLKLGAADPENANRFVITEGPTTSVGGELLVRRENSADPRWRTFFDIMSFTTGGGLSTLVFSLTWGWALYGLFKLFYAAGRAIFTSDEQHTATVSSDRTQLDFGEALPESLADASHVEIRSGDSPTVRKITARSGATITLSAAVPFTGEVSVSAYTLTDDDAGWDWKKYYPAVVPDAAAPHVISLEPVNGSTLSLDTFDRLLLRAETMMTTTRVTRVNGDGSVELESVAPFTGPERRLSVAHLNFDNPEGAVSTGSNIADAFLNPTRINGMEWMRVVMDPYGELDLRARFEHPVARWITRVGRWLFGARSWSILFPGWFFWDNVPHQVATQPIPGGGGATRNMGHLSQMEQEASASSGDLYAPTSRLYPEGRDTQVVGDLSRFWFWRWDAGRANVTVIQTARRDAPGVHYQQGQWPIVLPSVTPETGGAAPRTPNDGATTPGTPGAANPANAGNQLPDALTFRDFTRAVDAPTDGVVGAGAATVTPAAFLPAPTAFIPSSPELERVIGAFTAFTRPGTHRVSVQDNIGNWFSAREAHEGGNSFGITFRQPILYDITVSDVTVTIAGQSVGNDGQVTLVATQRAVVAILPNGEKRYAVSVVQAASGPVLRTDGNRELVAFGVGTGEVVEISRVHTRGTGDLDTYGFHLLDGDLHIPVRRLTADVVDTIPLRRPMPDATALLADVANANVITSMQVGDVAFLLVPTALRGALEIATVDGAPPGPDAPTLVQDAAGNLDPTLGLYLGVEGSALTVQFETAQPLAAGVDIVLTLDVGRSGNEATLTTAVRLEP